MIDKKKGIATYLIVGDSITENADLEPICGRKPINAGISGATSQTWVRVVAELADAARPDFIVIAVGSNDARLKRMNFRGVMSELVASIHSYKIVLVPAMPRADAEVKSYNDVLRSLGVNAKELSVVRTLDGVHLDAETYKEWRAAIASAVHDRIGCNVPAVE